MSTDLQNDSDPQDKGVAKSAASPRLGLIQRGMRRFKSLKQIHLPASSLRSTLATGAFWSLAGSVVSRGCALVAAVLLARILGKMGYGRWGIVLSNIFMFGQFASFGLAMTITKYIAELRRRDPERAGRILSLVLMIGAASIFTAAALLTCLSGPLAVHLYQDPTLHLPLALAGLLVLTFIGTAVLQGALAGFEDFAFIALGNAFQGVIFISSAPLLALWAGLSGAVLGMILAWGANLAVCILRLRRNCRVYGIFLTARGAWRERSIIYNFSIPSLLQGAVTGPAMMLSQAIVARLPGGMFGLGGFQAAVRWRDIVMFAPQAVRRVTLPMLSGLRGERDHKRFMRALKANVVLNGGIAALGALPIILLSKWILSWYGVEFVQDWDMMMILVGSSIFQAINDVFTQVTACLEKMWWNFGVHVVWAAILLGGTSILVQKHGVRGYVYSLAAATAIYSILNVAVAVVMLRRERI